MRPRVNASFTTGLVSGVAVAIVVGSVTWYFIRVNITSRQDTIPSATSSFTIGSSPPEVNVSSLQKPTVDCTQTREYANPRLELSFKYPACFTIVEPNPQYGQNSWIYIDYTQIEPTKTHQLAWGTSLFTVSSIPFDKNTFEQNVRHWMRYEVFSTSGLLYGDPIVKEENPISVGGKVGIQYTIYLRKTGETYLYIYLPWNNQVVRAIMVNENLGAEADRQAEIILNTMTFE